jgi:hypothetical protein
MGFFGGLGKAIAAPGKLIHKGVKQVGGGVNKAVQKLPGLGKGRGMAAPRKLGR